MGIILCVTAGTIGWEVFPALSCVARHTRLIAVRASQREAGCRVVESGDRLPCRRGVTTLAFAPQLTAMRILAGMAAGTVAGLAAIVIADVAALAFDPFVCAGQGKIRIGVVERCAIEVNQSGSASFVLAVAALAGTSACRIEFAMEAGARGNV